MFWEKMNSAEIRSAVFAALQRNTSYRQGYLLGLPGSFLDREVFPPHPSLKDAPFLSCMMENPNHIGCHTLGTFEEMFAGTHEIERDLIRICAEEILGAESGSVDGYVATGGTEANLEALWIFRNFFRDVHQAPPGSIGVLHSKDTHYSVDKGADLLGLVPVKISVNKQTREMDLEDLQHRLEEALRSGVRYFAVILNMGTTMFGSVDKIEPVIAALEALEVPWKVHVDAAFGGFLYPFTTPKNPLSFRDERISSFTLDAHKMLQAPYGTGVFLARKGLMQHVQTSEASYVQGTDYTLCGSRSGTNAVAVWMILRSYGSEGGVEFLSKLNARADELCLSLAGMGVRYFREPGMNVVTMRAEDIPKEISLKYHLVPDTHSGTPNWWKIVVMDHVSAEVLLEFCEDLSEKREAVSVSSKAL